MLNFIQQTLGIGKVTIYENRASFDVIKLKEVGIIIDIFTNYPLKTHKHLNFLHFKQAYELYTNTSPVTSGVVEEITKLKKGMNKQITEFNMGEDYKPIITPYWLLGFVEGEGSFSVIKTHNYLLRFSIGQSYKDLVLMNEIKKFFNELGKPL